MAFWTNLINAIFLPGRPILGSTGVALRDNMSAIAEGAAGAPRIAIGALHRLTAGGVIRSRFDATVSLDEATSVGANAFSFIQAGTIRVVFERASSSGVGAIRRWRNGAYTTLSTFPATGSSSTWVSATLDVPVLPGDEISCIKIGSPGVAVRNFRYCTDGVDLFPGSRLPLEGNTYNA